MPKILVKRELESFLILGKFINLIKSLSWLELILILIDNVKGSIHKNITSRPSLEMPHSSEITQHWFQL